MASLDDGDVEVPQLAPQYPELSDSEEKSHTWLENRAVVLYKFQGDIQAEAEQTADSTDMCVKVLTLAQVATSFFVSNSYDCQIARFIVSLTSGAFLLGFVTYGFAAHRKLKMLKIPINVLEKKIENFKAHIKRFESRVAEKIQLEDAHLGANPSKGSTNSGPIGSRVFMVTQYRDLLSEFSVTSHKVSMFSFFIGSLIIVVAFLMGTFMKDCSSTDHMFDA